MMRISGKMRGLLLLSILAALGIWLVRGGPEYPFVKGLFGERNQKLKVEDFHFEPVTRRDVHQKVLATGTVSLKTGAEVKIGTRISGQLEKLGVRIGDSVEKGDLIAVIEHQDLLSRVAKFKADLRSEEVRLMKIQQESPLEINKARAELEELEVQLRLAKKNLQRNLELNKQGFISTTAIDEAEKEEAVLQAKLKLALEQLKLLEMKLQNDIQLAETIVEKARANLKEEEILLSYAKITAPIDGVVAFISTQEGETVVASLSAPTFVTLIDLDQLETTVFVDETDIGRVKTGQTAVFTVDAYADKFFKGVVREIHPKAVIKDNVVNYEVILEIDPAHIGLLRPEMTANVVITTGTRPLVLTIPREAVNRLGKKSFVILKENGVLIEKPIATGWREDKYIEVVSGLNEGDEVGLRNKPKIKRRGRRPRG